MKQPSKKKSAKRIKQESELIMTSQYKSREQLEAEIQEKVSKSKGMSTYMEVTADIMEEIGVDPSFFKTLLTPKIIRLIEDEAKRLNYLPRPKGFEA